MAGKKAGPKSPSKAAPVAANVSADAQKKLTELKAEGNHAFARGDYAKAIGTYDDAIKLLPDTPDKAELINNKAACYIALKRYKEAVKECTSALDVAPNMANALKRRAKAYEHQGLYKQALADMQAVNRTDAASDDTRAAEKRLKDQLAGRGSASGASLATAPARGSSALSAANGSAAARGAAGRVPGLANTTFAAKLSLGDETKLLHITATTSYAELLSAAQSKFPNAGPIVLRYVDKEGDLVTLTCRADLQQAIGELLMANRNHISAGPHGPKLQNLPPIKISVATVASEADVPKPPLEEEMERQQQAYLRAQQLQAKARKDSELIQQAAQQAAAAAAQQASQAEEYHVDPWLLEFASLFREMTGVSPDQHVEPHNVGWDALTKSMDATLHHEKALPLLEKATESFKEVACLGLMNWGNVHQVKGQRLVEEAGRTGKQLSEVEEAVFSEFAEAERRYKEALAYKDDFFEGVCAMAQLAFERAKIKTGVVVQPAKAEEGAAPRTPEQSAADQHAALSEALAKLTVAGLDSAEPYLTQAVEWVDKAIAVAPTLDAKRAEAQAAAKEASSKGAADGAQQQQPDYSYAEQAQVMKGNFLYEWSQLVAAVKPDAWRPVLDQAAELFRKAGCPEKDVRGALKNHYKRDLIDLGPEPEEPAPAAAAAAEKKEEAAAPEKPAPAAKGLPSLEVKKKAAKAAAE